MSEFVLRGFRFDGSRTSREQAVAMGGDGQAGPDQLSNSNSQ